MRYTFIRVGFRGISSGTVPWGVAMAGVVLVAGGGCSRSTETPPAAKQSVSTPSRAKLALPSFESPFLNTSSEAKYVGSDVCGRCHSGQDATYRHTGMGRSMALVDPAAEPPDATFDHVPSKRRYQVVRREGQMWHRELLLIAQPDADEVVLSEFPVKYVVGSGRHSRTYLVEVDGFLVESPVTWYSVRQTWGMSPGYDRADHLSFERSTGQGCLECHAGRTAAVERSLHKMEVHEAAIGCERCHGPGSLHLDKYRDWDPSVGPAASSEKIDPTIVNPAHLSRDLSEAICQQCHLRSNATIVGRDRDLSDFRPGLPLEDFRQDYRLEVPNTPMTVVSHVEQMHLSRCYQASAKLSCLTCHNPHAEPQTGAASDSHNAICATCHPVDACRAAPEARTGTTPADNCAQCHMPRSETEIPHLALTNHRIGIHVPAQPRESSSEPSPRDRAPPDPAPQDLGELRSFHDLSRLSTLDQKRSLGLAYLETGSRQENRAHATAYRQRALALLLEIHNAGLDDPAVDAALARLMFDLQTGSPDPFVQSALARPTLAGQDRCNVLYLLADSHIQQRRYADALPVARELTALRRHSVDWLMVADCERALGEDGIESLETAVRISPRLQKVHQFLAAHYRQLKDSERAHWHERRAAP